MSSFRGRCRRTALLACVLATVPAAASASTLTVDDDQQDCPNAGFTSIQAAINQAAPHDTVKICPGTYNESSTPFNSTASPSQTGSRNGLTIQKPLNLVGAGASKVFIQPSANGPTTLAGTAPYLRDGGGNVITVARQSLGSTDADENGVNISGVTVRSPSTYAEAGVAFFNTSGTISNSVIGPLASPTAVGSTVALSPYGWGVIETNSLQGAGTGTIRRQVTISNSLVTGYQSGGVLFDDGYGIDGAATNNQRSGIQQYGVLDHTRVEGSGPVARGQIGVEYHDGQRGSIVNSEIANNYSSTAPETSYGLLLADANTEADPTNPPAAGFSVSGTSFTGDGYAIYNGDATAAAVRTGAPANAPANYFGCATGLVTTAPTGATQTGCESVSGNDGAAAASVNFSPVLPSAPPALTVPAATADAAPTVAIADPKDGSVAAVGNTVEPVVVADDDFGVKAVSLTAGAASLGTIKHTPYEFTWSPKAADAGTSVALVATATDSNGVKTSTTIHVTVPAAATPTATTTPTVTATPTASPTATTTATVVATTTATPVPPYTLPSLTAKITGTPTVGSTLTCAKDGGPAAPATVTYAWTRGTSPIKGATRSTYTLVKGDLAADVACVVTAGTEAATSQPVTVRFIATKTKRGAGPALVTTKRRIASAKTLKLGSVECVELGGGTCQVTVKTTVKAGRVTSKAKDVLSVRRGAKGKLTVQPNARTRKAIRKHGGKVKVTCIVTNDDTSGRATSTVSIKKH